jgi:hypothetical protein
MLILQMIVVAQTDSIRPNAAHIVPIHHDTLFPIRPLLLLVLSLPKSICQPTTNHVNNTKTQRSSPRNASYSKLIPQSLPP